MLFTIQSIKNEPRQLEFYAVENSITVGMSVLLLLLVGWLCAALSRYDLAQYIFEWPQHRKQRIVCTVQCSLFYCDSTYLYEIQPNTGIV